MSQQRNNEASFAVSASLACIGVLSLIGFITLFLNIPWQWSMFMDDTAYNEWMPKVTNFWPTLRAEVSQYWSLGRFYPVKYVANLLKWRYLPNDPTVFREFNFSVYLCFVSVSALACLRLSKMPKRAPLFFFILGSSFLHKPLLETISLNPIGETWVCFFFAIGAFFLFSENWFSRYFLARLCFVLVALSKEPAALVFFAAAMSYAVLAWVENKKRRAYIFQAGLDFILFAIFLGVSLTVMAHGSFTKGAYFATTPWLLYIHDFFYKLARYALWTSPFLLVFSLSYRELYQLLTKGPSQFRAAAVFFLTFALSYLVFMSSQGITAYQELPASMGFFCLFAVLSVMLFQFGNLYLVFQRFGAVILLFYCLSFAISVGRWHRFVRGIIEPRAAVVNLLKTGEQVTLLIPRGEIFGHVQRLIQQFNKTSRVFEIDTRFPMVASTELRGKIFVFEFPYYMGPQDAGVLSQAKELVGGWSNEIDAASYKIYVGKKLFSGDQ